MTTTTLRLGLLRPQDRQAWEPLARGYKAFYETAVDDAGYEAAWQRLMAGGVMLGLGAWVAAATPAATPDDAPGQPSQPERLVGIAHALFHASTWSAGNCYLQDLFTADDVRGQGVAGALIAHLATLAHARGVDRLHWLTHHSNARARRLYDRVAVNKGFIRYDHPLPP
ncbi:MAG: GNAT family N-acetyltransferase [Pseudomonadota bacterium]